MFKFGKSFGHRKHTVAGYRPDAAVPEQSAALPEAAPPQGRDWYHTRSSDGSIRQVVIPMPPAAVTETSFGLLILPADKYPILAMNSWCAGFCSINGQKLMMLRSASFAQEVRTAGMTLALSFCHMPSHPLLLATVRIESAGLTPRVRSRFSHVPPLSRPIAEWVSGLSPYDRELIPGVLAAEPFRLLLAEDSSSVNSVYMPDGHFEESAMPQAVCEFHVALDNEARQIMREEWAALLKHDATIPSYRRDFQRANNAELVKLMPVDRDPIFPRRS